VEKYGGDGYMVFFGTLEVMAREFDVKAPGNCTVSVRYLAKKLQLSTKLVIKILNYCAEKNRIYYTLTGTTISLNCPKLIKMCDEFTTRMLKQESGVEPDKVGTESGTEVEVEVEVEKDKTIRMQSIVYKDEKFTEIPEKFLQKWKQVAPGIDIAVEVKKAELWLISNPDKKRSKWGAFLSGWMIRAQNHYIKYGGTNGKGIRTARSDPRDRALQSRADAEIEAVTRQWEASQTQSGCDPGRDARDNDVPDFLTPG